MTLVQEDALYDFLLNRLEPFTLKEVTAAVREKDGTHFGRLSTDIARLIKQHRLAFDTGLYRWVTRSGCFTGAQFVVRPSRDEIVNGILIPGHRFIAFANPAVLQKEYTCLWKGAAIPYQDTEASPEELNPYYALFGDEFIPQIIARENPANEEAYNADPYVDPPEVSIKTLNMNSFYRETSFVPGDRVVFTVLSWSKGIFEVGKAPADAWSKELIDEWQHCAESGFTQCFEKMGPSITIDEQIGWAYFLGGERMRTAPAHSMEDFLFEKTDKIESMPFGIETRLWFAGKEIPDYSSLHGIQTQSDETPIERMLAHYNIPVSEFVVQSYVYDALYRKDKEVGTVIDRVTPHSIQMRRRHSEMLAGYILDCYHEFSPNYTVFIDKKTGPLRQRAGELHTAVIDFAARLAKGDFDRSWLPTHAFIILSQIQNHSAAVLEDLICDVELSDNDTASIETSLESMIETFDDMKEMLDRSIENYRRSNISVVRTDTPPELVWRIVQISIGGTGVWRRLVLPQTIRLFEAHKLIQTLFGWTDIYPYRFIFEYQTNPDLLNAEKNIKTSLELGEITGHGFSELTYEYGTRWTVKILILAVHNAGANEKAVCIAGENAPPPEKIEGPLRFRRFIASLDSHNEEERAQARTYLGGRFDEEFFDINQCNKDIAPVFAALKQ